MVIPQTNSQIKLFLFYLICEFVCGFCGHKKKKKRKEKKHRPVRLTKLCFENYVALSTVSVGLFSANIGWQKSEIDITFYGPGS